MQPETPEMEISRLKAEVAEFKRQDRKRTMLVIFAVVVSLLAGVNSVVYANHTREQSDQHSDQQISNFCELLTFMDSTYQSTGPTTQTGQQMATVIHKLRMKNCG